MGSELASEIYDIAHLTGSFRLRSGATASEYSDEYRFEALPDLLAGSPAVREAPTAVGVGLRPLFGRSDLR